MNENDKELAMKIWDENCLGRDICNDDDRFTEETFYSALEEFLKKRYER